MSTKERPGHSGSYFRKFVPDNTKHAEPMHRTEDDRYAYSQVVVDQHYAMERRSNHLSLPKE